LIRRATAFVATVVAALLVTTVAGRAECITQTATAILESKLNELVFFGRVAQITRTADFGYRATFEVQRVWKGSTAKHTELYVWELAPEVPRFEVGRTYVAVARRLVDPKVREGAGVPQGDALVFTPAQCSDPPSLVPNIVEALGVGKPPL
jgi:hypothetical protein